MDALLQSYDADLCPPSAAFFGMIGASSALIFANLGAAYGTAKSGVGIAAAGVMKPDGIMKSIIPVVMAGILGIYGLIIAVIVGTKITGPDSEPGYSAFKGYAHLAAGLSTGLSGLAAGLAIGIAGDAGVRASARQPKMYVGLILILIFAEVLGLYGLIVALILQTSAESNGPQSCKKQ
eukprot:EC693145.1.p2 GENE.EC693145.1~~EC693145.1.p2  ORF type:complete len:179 (+),score=47.92 EC693145.1:148-684(+)